LLFSCIKSCCIFQEVLVRFAGFGPEEDEWVNVRKHVRPRSLPCESSECVAVLPGDLILCFQVGICASASKKCIYSGRKRSYSNQILETPLFNALKFFRKVKSRLFTLTPMSLMHKEEDMM
jgi:hypothetical protein